MNIWIKINWNNSMRYSRLSLNLSLNISSHFRVLFQWYSYYSWKHSSFSNWNSHRRIQNFSSQRGDIDVSDGCWRQNVFVTSLRCWWLIQDVGDWFKMLVTDLIHWKNHQHNEKSRQHDDHHKITNISLSLTSLSP